MGKAQGNQYWVGSNGRCWINDKLYSNVSAFEAKLTVEYEEIPQGMTTVKVPVGYKISGSVKLRKTGGESKELMGDIKSGIVPDIKIVGKTMNKDTGKTERIAYEGVTFNEFDLGSFEEKKVAEIELPFDAVDYEWLD